MLRTLTPIAMVLFSSSLGPHEPSLDFTHTNEYLKTKTLPTLHSFKHITVISESSTHFPHSLHYQSSNDPTATLSATPPVSHTNQNTRHYRLPSLLYSGEAQLLLALHDSDRVSFIRLTVLWLPTPCTYWVPKVNLGRRFRNRGERS